MTTQRQATYNRTPSVRGDTLLGFSVVVAIDGAPAQLSSARLQLRNAAGGALVYDWPAIVDGGRVTLADVSATTTAKWPTGAHTYDLELTLTNGRTVTWLEGTQPITPDRTRRHAKHRHSHHH